MKKIIVFGVHEGEKEHLKNWEKENNIKLTICEEDLTLDTIDQVHGHDGICIQQTKFIDDEQIYKKLNEFGLKQFTTRTAGIDMFHQQYAKKYNLKITNVPSYSPNAIAELALTQTMNLVRKMYVTNQKIAKNDYNWEGSLAPEIRSLTIGVIGYGKIGSVYASLVKSLGAKVIAYDILDKQAEGIEFKSSLQEVLQQADVVSLHVPHTNLTEYMINEQTLKYFKPSAYLVNTARGMVVDTKALIKALKEKRLAGAALDVLEDEEVIFNKVIEHEHISNPDIKELLTLDNVLITPHIAFYTHTALKNMVDISLDSVKEIIL